MNTYEVMSVNVMAAKSNATIIEIATRIVLGSFNGMPIIDDMGKVIGVVTALDILKAIKDHKNIDTISAEDIMTPNPATVNQDSDLTEVIDIMYRKGIEMLPVVEEDDGRLVGVISRHDILREKINERFITIDRRTPSNLTER